MARNAMVGGRPVANGGDRLGIDAVLDAVAHRERRALLDHLANSPEGHSSAADAIDALVDAHQSTPNRDHLHHSLYHVHLPKLTEYGLVEYDARSETLRYHPNDRVEKLIEFIKEELVCGE